MAAGGLSHRAIAAELGVNHSTVTRWLRRDQSRA
ncbi:MAG: helix-turn-helix domain-containing protein [Ginsengibacter sp.]